jgi:hypothetical protein
VKGRAGLWLLFALAAFIIFLMIRGTGLIERLG